MLKKVNFFKTNKTNKKQKIVFTDYKTCKFIVKIVKNTQETHFQKNWSLFQKIYSKKNQNVPFP